MIFRLIANLAVSIGVGLAVLGHMYPLAAGLFSFAVLTNVSIRRE